MSTVTLRAVDVAGLKAEIRAIEQQIRVFKDGSRASRRGDLTKLQLKRWNADMPFCQSNLPGLKAYITLLHEARASLRGRFHQVQLQDIARAALARQLQAEQVSDILSEFTVPVLVMEEAVQRAAALRPAPSNSYR